MRVLHCAETVRGGPATVLRQLVQGQQAAGLDVHVLVPAEHAGDLGELPGLAVHEFHRTRRDARSLLRFATVFILTLRRTRPDVVHLHSSFAGAICRPALLLLRPLSRPKVVYSPHCWSFVSLHRRVTRTAAIAVERLLARSTDRIICGSRFERAAGRAVAPEARLVVVPTAVEAPLAITDPRQEAASDTGRVRLAFVGRLDEQKGFDLLIRAARRLPPDAYEIVVVGDFVRGSGDRPALPNLMYLGWQDRVQLAEVFRSVSAVVMPSRWESFGLVAMEAMSYGTPVVASDTCSLPELVHDGLTGWLFTSEDVDDLVRVLHQVPATPLPAMVSACISKYEQHTSDVMVGHCLRAYEDPRYTSWPLGAA